MEVKQSGKNPNDVLREMYKNGQITDDQLSQLQKQARMFGVRISNEDINKIKSVNNQPKKYGWF